MMNLSKDDLQYGRGFQIQLMDKIFKDLSERYAQHLPTKELHFSWETAKLMDELLQKTKSLYGIPVIIHQENDPEFSWKFK